MITFNLNNWKRWLSEAAQEQFAVNGFYSEVFRTSDGTEHPNVRVIAINTETCYNFNFYLMKFRDDPADQLAWLEKTLMEMEANGQIAILVGHVPPGSDSCLYQWAERYRALMDRYQNIIRLSFFGHIHTEEHNGIRAINSDKSVGLNFWTGSMTTFSFKYPSFRRFIVDADTMVPLKIETYKMEVDAADPEFYLDHEMTEYYNLPDLSPQSFDELSERFKDDEELALKYLNTKGQNSPKLVHSSCDESCRLSVYC